MHRYTIKYEGEDGMKFEVFEGSDPGHALEKAIRAGIKPISATREGKFLDGHGFTTWNCPSLAKVEPLPKEKAEQLIMEL